MLLLFLRASKKRKVLSVFLVILLVSLSLVYDLQYARGALTTVSNKINNSIPGAANVQYVTTFTPSASAIQCIQIAITSTTATPSAIPTGFLSTSAAKSLVSGAGLTDGNWAIYNSVNGVLQYEGTAPQTPGGAVTITTGTAGAGITNPSSSGIYYAQIRTYTGLASHICTGVTDFATVAFAITAGQALSVNVDPSMSFSISNLGFGQSINGVTTNIDNSTASTSANTIPMGRVNPSFNPIVGQSLSVQTNAVNGYTVYASYSAQLSDGNGNTIADHTGTNVAPAVFPAPGTSAFGYTTSSTTLSAVGAGATRFQTNKWSKFEMWGYEVARKATKTSGADVTNVGIQVGVDGSQAAGTYTTTIIYVATPTY